MKELELYREDNGQYSTSEAKQDDVSGVYVQKTDYDELRVEHYDERAKVQELLKENAELRASNAEPAKELEYFTNRVETGSIASRVTYARFKNTLDKTPAQHLADIQAAAVRDYEASLSSFAFTAEEYISEIIMGESK